MRILTLLLLLCTGLCGHDILVGTGTRSILRLSRAGVFVSFNIGYSASAAEEAMRAMDASGDGAIQREERRAWLDGLADSMRVALELRIDGRPLPWRVREEFDGRPGVRSEGLLLAPVEPFPCDVWIELAAWCILEPGQTYVIELRDSSFAGGISSQEYLIPQPLLADGSLSTSFEEDALAGGIRVDRDPSYVTYRAPDLRLELSFADTAGHPELKDLPPEDVVPMSLVTEPAAPPVETAAVATQTPTAPGLTEVEQEELRRRRRGPFVLGVLAVGMGLCALLVRTFDRRGNRGTRRILLVFAAVLVGGGLYVIHVAAAGGAFDPETSAWVWRGAVGTSGAICVLALLRDLAGTPRPPEARDAQ